MTLIAKRFLAALLAFLIAAPFALAQAQRTYSQAELDRMLAPIALYPDPLLSQILMASTYPLEVVEAARWSRANPHLKGDDAVRAVQDEDWDPSVKSLVAFPQVLARMGENPDWTRSLGDAFLAQQPHVMDTVQQLRRRAQASGNLVQDDRVRVIEQSNSIVIAPANPRIVYVPYYDPWVVYGPWWWPAYPPVVWAPWPGYVRYHRPGVLVSFWWGAPIGLSVNFFFGDCDWPRRHVRVVHVSNYYYRPTVVRRDTHVLHHVNVAPGRWQHNPHHRRGLEYRDAAVRQEFAAARTEARTATRAESRNEPRLEQRQAQPQAQPQVQPRVRSQERAQNRRGESRNESFQQRERQPATQSRQEPRPRMPEATAPQQPRAQRQERRQEPRHEPRREPQNERGHRGSERS